MSSKQERISVALTWWFVIAVSAGVAVIILELCGITL
jgi:uncharacterized Rmd1/YagE family protein